MPGGVSFRAEHWCHSRCRPGWGHPPVRSLRAAGRGRARRSATSRARHLALWRPRSRASPSRSRRAVFAVAFAVDRWSFPRRGPCRPAPPSDLLRPALRRRWRAAAVALAAPAPCVWPADGACGAPRAAGARRAPGRGTRPVWLVGCTATSSGVPSATTVPPPEPPSGPMSMTQSAVLMTSRLCSMTMTVLPLSVEPLQHAEQLADVLEVQAGGRLVEHVDGAAGRALLQLGGELDALRLAAGQGRRRLAEPDVAEADVDEGAQVPGDRGHRREEVGRLLDRHVEHLGDRLALEVHLERLAVVARAVADLARHVDVGQEVHLDLDRAVAGARLAATALDVEREPARAGSRGPSPRSSRRTACACGRRRRCRSPGWTAGCARSGSGRRARPCRRARGP